LVPQELLVLRVLKELQVLPAQQVRKVQKVTLEIQVLKVQQEQQVRRVLLVLTA
jgi:hypothetical protein